MDQSLGFGSPTAHGQAMVHGKSVAVTLRSSNQQTNQTHIMVQNDDRSTHTHTHKPFTNHFGSTHLADLQRVSSSVMVVVPNSGHL